MKPGFLLDVSRGEAKTFKIPCHRLTKFPPPRMYSRGKKQDPASPVENLSNLIKVKTKAQTLQQHVATGTFTASGPPGGRLDFPKRVLSSPRGIRRPCPKQQTPASRLSAPRFLRLGLGFTKSYLTTSTEKLNLYKTGVH